MEHQNWNPQIIKNNKGIYYNQTNKKKVLTYKNNKNTNNNINSKKLDESLELKHNYVPHNISKEIQLLRQSKGLTIKELATKLNINKQELINIEQGKALYNKAMINKIKRGLN